MPFNCFQYESISYAFLQYCASNLFGDLNKLLISPKYNSKRYAKYNIFQAALHIVDIITYMRQIIMHDVY